MAQHFQEPAVVHHPRDCPQIPEGARRVLDLGCGSGQTWHDCDIAPDGLACGVDCNLPALQMGKKQFAQVQFVCGLGEGLPFKDESFDFAFSRVALPYMDIRKTLAEVHRVLKPGAGLWTTLHPVSMVWNHLLASSRAFNLKDMIYRPYVMLNGFLFHSSGKLLRFPLNRKRCESFQTSRGMERALRATGFDKIEILRNTSFVVTARRVC